MQDTSEITATSAAMSSQAFRKVLKQYQLLVLENSADQEKDRDCLFNDLLYGSLAKTEELLVSALVNGSKIDCYSRLLHAVFNLQDVIVLLQAEFDLWLKNYEGISNTQEKILSDFHAAVLRKAILGQWTIVVSSADKLVINEVLSKLDKRECDIIKLRFGIDDGVIHPLGKIGNVYATGPERIRQLEARALRRLRHPIFGQPLRKIWEMSLADRYLELGDAVEPLKRENLQLQQTLADVEKNISTSPEFKAIQHQLFEARQQAEEYKKLLSRYEAVDADPKDKQLFDMPIDDITQFSTRTYHGLKNKGIKTVQQLIGFSEIDLLNCRNFGKVSMAEVNKFLTSKGLHLANHY